LISIVTPALCWNEWLQLCLASVADQEVHHEHIVQLADGAGFLGCPADHVRCYVEDDDGMYDALNKGYRKARGQIIAHLNCDEQYLPGTLAAVCQYFDSHPEIDILCGDTLVTATDGRLLAVRRSLIPTWFDENVRVRIQTCSMFFRRKIIDAGEYLETGMPVAADIEWIRRLRRKGYKFGHLPLFTSTFTETGTNLSLTRAALRDRRAYRERWPWWVKPLYPLELAFYYARALANGCFAAGPTRYALYTLPAPARRKTFYDRDPSFFWPGRGWRPRPLQKWHLKCLLYRVLSLFPDRSRLYFWIQQRVTKSIVPTVTRVRMKLGVALDYWEWLQANNRLDAATSGLHLDLGAGWKPVIPLAFYSFGISRQVLVDIEPVMRPETVRKSIEILDRVLRTDAEQRGIRVLKTPEANALTGSTHDMLQSLGMKYLAPYTTSDLSVLDGAVSLATCTQVLLHLDKPILAEVFSGVYKALRPGGLFMATVHLKPLYIGLELARNDIDHLRYSPERWRAFGSPLMYYTRLKAPDYRKLLEATGFLLAAFEVTPGTSDDLQRLQRADIHPCFAGYTPEDLVARHLFFVAEKPATT